MPAFYNESFSYLENPQSSNRQYPRILLVVDGIVLTQETHLATF